MSRLSSKDISEFAQTWRKERSSSIEKNIQKTYTPTHVWLVKISDRCYGVYLSLEEAQRKYEKLSSSKAESHIIIQKKKFSKLDFRELEMLHR